MAHQQDSEPHMMDAAPTGAGHMLPADDPENPHNWPISRKVFVSSVATAFAFVVYDTCLRYHKDITGLIATVLLELPSTPLASRE